MEEIREVLQFLEKHKLYESLYTLEVETKVTLNPYNENILYVRALVLQGAFEELLALTEVFYGSKKDPARSDQDSDGRCPENISSLLECGS